MNVLILTNHLIQLCGSEIQVLELYRYFKNNNHNTKIYANMIGLPIIEYFDQEDLISDIDQINLDIIDFIWSQHCIFASLFQNHLYKELHLKVVSVHLSPYEMLELSSLPYMKLLNCEFVANSYETRDKLISLGVDNNKILISGNCAPSQYLNKEPKVKYLHKILVVSNHLVEEVITAVDILSKKYEVNIIGGNKPKLVSPELINNHDLIISIGKTVQYGLLAGVPVYCYDHFGGPGYLDTKNFQKAKYYNFSGRGFNRKTAEQIVFEIENNYNHAFDFSYNFSEKNSFILENFLDKLINNQTKCLITQHQQKLLAPYIAIEKKIAELYTNMKRIELHANYLASELEIQKINLKQKEKYLENMTSEMHIIKTKIDFSDQKIKNLTFKKDKFFKKYQKYRKFMKLSLTLILINIFSFIIYAINF
ncbi:hypothetical protein [Snodgrassella alvi]|uniref:hypothetical protein n=1 Tax=Snodgrassella alvi TaxID=1196083 RepID=UPI0034603EE1